MRLRIGPLPFAFPNTKGRRRLRGRNSRNLYGARYDDALLDRPVAAVREELGLHRELPQPRSSDRLAFAGWGAIALAIVWGPLVPLALLGGLLAR